MTTENDKIEAVKVSLSAYEQGRLTDVELNKIAKVIDLTPTVEDQLVEDETEYN